MDLVNDRQIGAAGITSSAWAQWLAWKTTRQRIELDELLTADDRLVVIAPHPDDEVLTAGGLLQLHAARAGRCSLIVVTDGEASHGPTPDHARRALGMQRRAESDAGLARLGLPRSTARRLGLPDGAVRLHVDALTSALVSLLRPRDLVVSTWRLDGHPDHEAVGEATQEAAARAGASCASAPVWMWHWAAREDPRVPWQNLRGLRLSRDVVDRKVAALGEHRSQVADRSDGGTAILDTPILQRAAWHTEYFFV